MTIMKKILLIAAVALVTISASAMNRPRAPKGHMTNEKKAMIAPLGAFKSYAAKQAAENSFYANHNQESKNIVKRIASSSRRTGDDVELIPTYSEWTYHYSECIGGFAPQMMYDGASFAVNSDGTIYFAPFKELSYVTGQVNTTDENEYAKDGAQLITFTSGVIGHYTESEGKDPIDLYLEPCVVDPETYVPSRSGQKTFNAYYFPEDQELYIPSDVTLALFEADETKTEIFTPYFVARALDLIPQTMYNDAISKGTVYGKCYYGEKYDFTNANAQILLGEENSYFIVKGADWFNENAWVVFDVDEKNAARAIVSESQVLGEGSWYTDATYTDTYDALLVTVGVVTDDEGSLSGWAPDYASVYSITENSDETTTLKSTENTLYGEYMYAIPSDESGGYNFFELTINILYEPIETGINAVKVNAANSAAVYNLAGQKVGKDFKGIVVKDGKKYIQK